MCFQMVFALFFSFLPVSINLRDPRDGSARSSTCRGHTQSLALRSVQNKPQFQAPTRVCVRAAPGKHVYCSPVEVTLSCLTCFSPAILPPAVGAAKKKMRSS